MKAMLTCSPDSFHVQHAYLMLLTATLNTLHQGLQFQGVVLELLELSFLDAHARDAGVVSQHHSVAGDVVETLVTVCVSAIL